MTSLNDEGFGICNQTLHGIRIAGIVVAADPCCTVHQGEPGAVALVTGYEGQVETRD